MSSPTRKPGHLELTDKIAALRGEHPELFTLIEQNADLVFYHLTHDQKTKEVPFAPVQTEIGKHFEIWIKKPENRKKFDAQMPSDKFLIISALYNCDTSSSEYAGNDWLALSRSFGNQFTNDMRKYTGKKPHHTDDFRRALDKDGFLNDKGEITKSGFDQIKRIIEML